MMSEEPKRILKLFIDEDNERLLPLKNNIFKNKK
jgi:hypothetical protein